MNRAARVVGRAVLTRAARGYVNHRWRALKRDAVRPWREGADGTAASVGRWIGLSLAVGAKALGAGAAFYIFTKRR